MSNWIRIDDDTYIDGSLVTCAEYQLFIDEMREQGKYHQPDHWKEYHFPKGHARQPILGMRPSDAVAFCEWLTQQNNDIWRYRLPSQQESQEYTILEPHSSPIGYWIKKESDGDNFAWVGERPKNPRAISLDLTFTKFIDIEHSNFLDVPINLDSASFFDTNSDSATNRERISERIRARKLKIAIDHAKAFVIDFALGHNAADSRKFASTLDNARAHVNAVGRVLGTNVYVDLYTLRERIAARSPAFEGIRLVRERIK
ncbi:MAG: SUMF1/EgtB/PvdO family nonheme iron enzyme [Anaerolineales bacterium]|jgi:hypothetical protein|nr:SUMF1/EgtB/PvdO family nonheme iron enzyme [Anaerolineales bacterium]